MIFNSVVINDAGHYTCIAKNRAGEDRFKVNLNVRPREQANPPRFVERLQPITVAQGDAVTLRATAEGVPSPMMSWHKEGRIINPGPALEEVEGLILITDGSTSQLQIASADRRHNAWFQCIAANVAGTASTRAKVTVTGESFALSTKFYIISRTFLCAANCLL